MAKKFGALADFRQSQEPPLQDSPIEAVNSPVPPGAKKGGRPAGKRSNPDFEPTTVLLRKQTKKRTWRLLEDIESDLDLSDLIESLLENWNSQHS